METEQQVEMFEEDDSCSRNDGIANVAGHLQGTRPAGLTRREVTRTALSIQDETWLEGTQQHQRKLLRLMRELKVDWSTRRALSIHQRQLISEVAQEFIAYLALDAKLSSQAALDARRVVLQQGLTKLKGQVNREQIATVGIAIQDIEAIFLMHQAGIKSPLLRQKYEAYFSSLIEDLLERPGEH